MMEAMTLSKFILSPETLSPSVVTIAENRHNQV